jgi:hypothetical protein
LHAQRVARIKSALNTAINNAEIGEKKGQAQIRFGSEEKTLFIMIAVERYHNLADIVYFNLAHTTGSDVYEYMLIYHTNDKTLDLGQALLSLLLGTPKLGANIRTLLLAFVWNDANLPWTSSFVTLGLRNGHHVRHSIAQKILEMDCMALVLFINCIRSRISLKKSLRIGRCVVKRSHSSKLSVVHAP